MKEPFHSLSEFIKIHKSSVYVFFSHWLIKALHHQFLTHRLIGSFRSSCLDNSWETCSYFPVRSMISEELLTLHSILPDSSCKKRASRNCWFSTEQIFHAVSIPLLLPRFSALWELTFLQSLENAQSQANVTILYQPLRALINSFNLFSWLFYNIQSLHRIYSVCFSIINKIAYVVWWIESNIYWRCLILVYFFLKLLFRLIQFDIRYRKL